MSSEINLADAELGAKALFANDEFFGPRSRMLSPLEPVFVADKFDEHGKWMDGWETRRRRDDGYDHCVVRLAFPGMVENLDLDTRFFRAITRHMPRSMRATMTIR